MSFVVGPTITVDPTSPGITIPNDFVGFSYEHSYVTLNKFKNSNTALKNFFNLFNSKIGLRLGGNTCDTQIAPNAFIDDMCNFVTTTGVTSLLYGLPGKIISPSITDADQGAVDAAIALRIHNILGDVIPTYQIGNETNFYGISYATYASRWQTIHDAITASVAAAKFAGSDDGTSTVSRPAFLLQFVPDKGSQCQLYTYHKYGTTGQNNSSVTVPIVVNNYQFIQDARAFAGGTTFSAHKLRLSEIGTMNSTNTTDGPTLGASVFSMRTMALAAAYGWAGVNFHGTESTTNGYAPLRDNGDGTWNSGQAWSVPGDVYDGNGTYTAQSTFYAMKLFHPLVGGQVLPTKHLYGEGFVLGVKGADTKTRVLVINPNLTAGLSIPITSASAFTSATSQMLTGTDYETTSVTLGGATASSTGVFNPGSNTLSVASNTTTLDLPPASSAVVTLT